jgi:hypothetical protein
MNTIVMPFNLYGIINCLATRWIQNSFSYSPVFRTSPSYCAFILNFFLVNIGFAAYPFRASFPSSSGRVLITNAATSLSSLNHQVLKSPLSDSPRLRDIIGFSLSPKYS